MPTYVCTTGEGRLDDARRQAVAAAICTAHEGTTGAPGILVQTVFAELPRGRRFLGPAVSDDHVFIRGDIRAGRDAAVRARLMQAIMTGVAEAAGVASRHIWVYLNALEPADMIEYGRVLPQPGGEQAWLDALPADLAGGGEGEG